jgi:hypothetical protein
MNLMLFMESTNKNLKIGDNMKNQNAVCIVCGIETNLCCSNHSEIIIVCANCDCPKCIKEEE